jgi:hypothetical protein
MTGHFFRWGAALAMVLAAAATVGACGSNKGTGSTQGSGAMPGTGGATATGGPNGGGGNNFIGSTGATMQGFDVEPAAPQTITVMIGQTMPPVAYTATLNGSPVPVGWGVDQGSIGSIPAALATSASFSPTGTAGGVVNVLASYMGQTLKRQILVKLTGSQSGPNSSPGEMAQTVPNTPAGQAQISAGGGVGGVGGEGLGPAVTDMPTLMALGAPTDDGASHSLTLLYPYDKTVWPRGMLAPLLMWSWSVGDADAIQIQLTSATGSFSWSGTFGRPPVLQSIPNGKYIRSPIPQDVWDMATNTVSGPSDKLTMSLTVASGGMAYGPLTQTWTVAPARLTGTVYYNSYGTGLVKNWGNNVDTMGNRIGAAILGVRSGDLGPSLVVGQDSSDDTGCRVCHVVSSKGRWLLTQSEQGNPGDGQSYLYDLTAMDVQGSSVTLMPQGTFAWAGLKGDGSYALTNSIDPSSSNPAINNSANGNATSSFWAFSASPVVGTLTGLPAGVAAGYPSYSPDDTLMTYVDATGSTQNIHGPIVVASYAAATQTFSNPMTVVTPASGQRVGYPVILPDNSGIIFETQVRQGSDNVLATRNGARSELWWTNLAGTVTPVALANANGKGYLPIGAMDHGADFNAPDPQYNPGADEASYDDTTLNYEPTVLPIVSGGYAWVVFTSRRLYGNQLTQTPWNSWPTNYNTKDITVAPTKKLWVVAIDLNAPPGTDPSHPGFYLPAQEILAGNSRGFWVLDPCKADGTTCDTGDQCCNGFCSGPPGALVCSDTPPGSCSGPQEKCSTAADCCDTTNKCINGFCAQAPPT